MTYDARLPMTPASSTPHSEASSADGRATFRRRLVVATGGALALALTALAGLIWLGAYAWFNHNARHVLRSETEGVLAQIVTPADTLNADGYAWNEPHHRFRGRHVDPFFLQVFDDRGRLLRASDNIDIFPEDAYPARPLVATTQNDGLYDPLRTFRVEEAKLYYTARPIYNDAGEQLGTVQLARTEPGLAALHRQLALFLGGGLLVVLGGLGALIWWVAGRVLRPLETITASTRTMAPDRLGQRIAVPDEADRETAQLAATLNTLLERIEASFEEMRRFTASAAHELKTPLTVLQGHVDVALRRPRDAEDYQETLRLVRRKIDHLISMVGGLLTLARLDQSEPPRPDEQVDVARLVRAEARSFREAATEQGVAVHAEVSEPAPVCGQAEMLREVVVNLLDNAVKYTPEGRIEVAVHRTEGTVVLTVKDTGVGMDAEERAQATDRFFRATSVNTTGIEGSGLGLALVEQIVRWHGGALDIASAPGEGTTVTVRLPEAANAPSDDPAVAA
jgi:signal transduction histidine kinase